MKGEFGGDAGGGTAMWEIGFEDSFLFPESMCNLLAFLAYSRLDLTVFLHSIQATVNTLTMGR